SRPRRLLAPGFSDDFLSNILRSFGVVAELHRVHRATLSAGPQVTDVAEHFGQRNQRAYYLNATCISHRLNLATARVEVADDVAHVFLWGTHFDFHDRLKQNRAGLLDALAQGHRTGDLERHL